MGYFKTFQGRREISIIWETGHSILWEKGHFILWETVNSILWELREILSSGNRTTCPLGIGPLILWDSGHPMGFGTSSGIRDILWDSGHALGFGTSSGIQDILWDSGHPLGFGTSSGKRDLGNRTRYPLGIGPLILWKHPQSDNNRIINNKFCKLLSGRIFISYPQWNILRVNPQYSKSTSILKDDMENLDNYLFQELKIIFKTIIFKELYENNTTKCCGSVSHF